MRSFSGLFANEMLKLWSKKRFAVVVLLALSLSLLISWAIYHSDQVNQQVNSVNQQIVNLQRSIESAKAGLAAGKASDPTAQRDLQSQIAQMETQLTMLEGLNSNRGPSASVRSVMKSEQQQLSDSGLDPSSKAQIEVDYRLNQYRLAHGIGLMVPGRQSAWQAFQNYLGATVPLLLPILVVFMISDIVSGEYATGTIKMLLNRPASRSRILLAKMAAFGCATALMLASCFCAVLLFDLVAYGVRDGMQPVAVNLVYETVRQLQNGTTQFSSVANLTHMSIVPVWAFDLVSMVLAWVSCIAVGSITFLLSVVFGSVSATMGISVGIMLLGVILPNVLGGSNQADWVLPFYFSHLNLMGAWTGDLSRTLATTLGLSLSILALWVIGSLGLSWRIFTRKDILA